MISSSHLVVFFFFYSLHFTVPSPHCGVPISHLIVLLSHLVVPLFFSSHLMVSFSHCAIPTSYITVLLSQMVVFLFFLTFDGSILTLGEVSVWTKNLSRSCNQRGRSREKLREIMQMIVSLQSLTLKCITRVFSLKVSLQFRE